MWLAAGLTIATALGAAAAEPAPAPQDTSVAVAGIFVSKPSLDRINRACGDDPACRGRSDNSNFYDLTRVNQRVNAADCSREEFVRRYGHEPCPTDMAWVCSPKWQVNVCMDRDLRREASGRFMGNVSRQECKAWCEQRGRRLPTNNEWLVACEGTQPSQCLQRATYHPIIYRLRSTQAWVYNNINCKAGTNAWRDCMSDLRLTDRMRDPRTGGMVGVPPAAETQRCISEYGVRNMVGVLGQWVSDTYGTRGQFNGGLYPQPASSCNYTTVAHPSDYTDYSIGCRCSDAIDTSVKAAAPAKPPVRRKAPAAAPKPQPKKTVAAK
jgi:hypothetical protein